MLRMFIAKWSHVPQLLLLPQSPAISVPIFPSTGKFVDAHMVRTRLRRKTAAVKQALAITPKRQPLNLLCRDLGSAELFDAVSGVEVNHRPKTDGGNPLRASR